MSTAENLKLETGSFPETRSGVAKHFLQLALSWSSLFTLFVSAVLFFAYKNRNEYLWSAEHGLGYAFGIVGGICMLLLLLYPLRKKSSKFSFFLGVKHWFKLHMLLGIAGPALILLHCNFHLGSTNSSIALVAMLMMVSSGLIGRYLYSRIHRGLYGSRIRLQEILNEKSTLLEKINSACPANQGKQQAIEEIPQLLRKYEEAVIQPASILGNLSRTATFSVSTRLASKRIQKIISANVSIPEKSNLAINMGALNIDNARKLKQMTRQYMQCVRRTAELSFYEKCFSVWHMLHLPIFGLLIVTALFHVYAVHSY